MNHVQDAAKDMARVGLGVGLVVAASVRRLRFSDLGSCALQTLKGFTDRASRVAGLKNEDWENDFVSSEGEFQGLREVRGRRRNRTYKSPLCRFVENFEEFQGLRIFRQERTHRVRCVRDLEESFTPKKAEASRELRPFKSQADSDGESLSQKAALPSVASKKIKR